MHVQAADIRSPQDVHDGDVIVDEIVVQKVTVHWTKASRGGRAAAARNRCPVAFRLPEAARWHHVEMAGHDAFAPRSESSGALPTTAVDELGLRGVDGHLRIRPNLSSSWAPMREWRPAAELSHGERLRWQVSYRVGLDGGWRYGLVTWNVGLLTGAADASAFLQKPTRVIEELAQLR